MPITREFVATTVAVVAAHTARRSLIQFRWQLVVQLSLFWGVAVRQLRAQHRGLKERQEEAGRSLAIVSEAEYVALGGR